MPSQLEATAKHCKEREDIEQEDERFGAATLSSAQLPCISNNQAHRRQHREDSKDTN